MMKYLFIIQTGFTGLKPLPRIARITQITRIKDFLTSTKHSWHSSIGVICGLKNPVNPVKER